MDNELSSYQISWIFLCPMKSNFLVFIIFHGHEYIYTQISWKIDGLKIGHEIENLHFYDHEKWAHRLFTTF